MASWKGNYDAASNTPFWAAATVEKEPSTTEAQRLYGNTSQGNGNSYVISVSIGNGQYQTSNVGYANGEYVSVYNVAGILKATANVSNVVVASVVATLPGIIANNVNKTAAVQKNLINTEWGN